MKKKRIILSIASIFFMASLFTAGTSNINSKPNKIEPFIKAVPQKTYTRQAAYQPSQIKRAYGLDKINATGKNQKIAIVVAYGSPTIEKDLAAFNSKFGIPASNLKILYPQGKPTTNDSGWAQETSLDVEWAHAIAPNATINLVVAKSDSYNDLIGAVDYASSLGVQVVSMSWGSDEFSSETSLDSHFTYKNTVYVASSGDSGAGTSWPAVSPNVLAVGGTSLYLDSAGNIKANEAGWSGSGGGISKFEKQPSYQQKLGISSNNRRTIPDVSLCADPNTGVLVNYNSNWYSFGGTSLSAPVWAGFIALADENKSIPLSNVQNQLYSLASNSQYVSNFRDITSGQNGNTSNYYAKKGYDLVTGLGSPIANNLFTTLTRK